MGDPKTIDQKIFRAQPKLVMKLGSLEFASTHGVP
jgi:hypothetical protein